MQCNAMKSVHLALVESSSSWRLALVFFYSFFFYTNVALSHRRTQAILPLKGKILNIEKASSEKVFTAHLVSCKSALLLQFHIVVSFLYSTPSMCAYGNKGTHSVFFSYLLYMTILSFNIYHRYPDLPECRAAGADLRPGSGRERRSFRPGPAALPPHRDHDGCGRGRCAHPPAAADLLLPLPEGAADPGVCLHRLPAAVQGHQQGPEWWWCLNCSNCFCQHG